MIPRESPRAIPAFTWSCCSVECSISAIFVSLSSFSSSVVLFFSYQHLQQEDLKGTRWTLQNVLYLNLNRAVRFPDRWVQMESGYSAKCYVSYKVKIVFITFFLVVVSVWLCHSNLMPFSRIIAILQSEHTLFCNKKDIPYCTCITLRCFMASAKVWIWIRREVYFLLICYQKWCQGFQMFCPSS